jgi:hypothetical protein
MHSWWQRDIIEPGKLPLLVCFTAFIITFLTTRGITRAIRAGHGPFHNISDGGTHVHHAVPGIILSSLARSSPSTRRRIPRQR